MFGATILIHSPHVTDEETEAWGGEVIWSKSPWGTETILRQKVSVFLEQENRTTAQRERKLRSILSTPNFQCPVQWCSKASRTDGNLYSFSIIAVTNCHKFHRFYSTSSLSYCSEGQKPDEGLTRLESRHCVPFCEFCGGICLLAFLGCWQNWVLCRCRTNVLLLTVNWGPFPAS